MTKRTLGLALLLGVLAACGGTSGSSGPVPIGSLYTTEEQALCQLEVTCGQLSSTTACMTDLGSAQTTEQATIIADVNAGIIKYDGDAAGKCFEEFLDNECQFDGGITNSNAPDCNAVFTGTVAAGGNCFYAEECAGSAACAQTDSTCNNDTTCCPGTCGSAQPAPGEIGQPCSAGEQECVTNSYCKLATIGSGGTCTALVTMVGSACDSTQDSCGAGLYCALSDDNMTGTCTAPGATGSTCVTSDEIPCSDSRDYCDAVSLTCKRDGAIGAACTPGTPCLPDATCVSGSCVANPNVGEPCGSGSADPQCTAGTCTAGTCTSTTAAGSACTPSA